MNPNKLKRINEIGFSSLGQISQKILALGEGQTLFKEAPEQATTYSEAIIEQLKIIQEQTKPHGGDHVKI